MKITSVVSPVSPVDQSPVNVDSEESSTKPVPIKSPLSPDPCSESPLSPEVSRSDDGSGVESASLIPVIPVVRVETVEDSQQRDSDKKSTSEAAKRTGGDRNTEEDVSSKRPTSLNYRMTMELERQLEEERETKKLLESPSAQVKPKRSSLRSRSPSLLDPGMTFGDCAPFGVTPAFSCKGNDGDDEIQILEERLKIDPDRQKNVITITLDSDDEDSKLPVLLRNPFYKESTVTVADQSKDNGPKKMKKSNTVSNCKPGEETSTDKRPGQSENVSFITKREKTDQNTILQVLNKVKDKVKPESSSFSELPPLENFAKGMPEMPLQDERSVYTGRLARVLNILQTRKRKRDLDDDTDDSDDGLQDESSVYTGRLARGLNILRTRKRKRNLDDDTDDSDDGLLDESSMYTGRLARDSNILQTRKRKRDWENYSDDSDDGLQIE